MARLEPLATEALGDEARESMAAIAATRGEDPSSRRVELPDIYRILLRCPDAAYHIAATPTSIRAGAVLTQYQQEIVVLTVARDTGARMQWDIHVPRARDAGVADEVIDAIGRGDMAPLPRADVLLVEFTERVGSGTMTDAAFAAVVELMGEDAVVAVTILAAFTSMMIQVVQTFGLDE